MFPAQINRIEKSASIERAQEFSQGLVVCVVVYAICTEENQNKARVPEVAGLSLNESASEWRLEEVWAFVALGKYPSGLPCR